MEDPELAAEVRSLYEQIHEADPRAYIGFVSDAAIRAVAKKHDLDWRVVYKAYRAEYPLSTRTSRGANPIPFNARQASPEALTIRDAYLSSET